MTCVIDASSSAVAAPACDEVACKGVMRAPAGALAEASARTPERDSVEETADASSAHKKNNALRNVKK